MMEEEEEEAAAMENSTYYSGLYGGAGGYGNLCSMLEGGNGSSIGGELGFLEMLGVQEFQINPMGCMFEEMVHRELLMQQSFVDQVAAAAGGEGCKNGYEKKKKVVVVNKEGVSKQFELDGNNTPGTPNSSSISLASNNEGVVVESEQEKGEDDDGDGNRDEDEEEEEEQGDDHEGSDKSKKQQ